MNDGAGIISEEIFGWKLFIASILSFVVISITAVAVIKKIKSDKETKNILGKPLNILIAGVFVAVFFIFFPIYSTDYFDNEKWTAIRAVLLSIHNTMRVFILDGEFNVIRDAVESATKLSYHCKLWINVYSAVLYVLAPALTASFVLTMFKNVSSEMKYKLTNNKSVFIFSKLNDKSVAVAESIFKKESNNGKKSNVMFVFCDVYDKTQEEFSELYTRAEKIDSIFTQKNINDVDIKKKKGRVELFYISDDESENVSQAVEFIGGETKVKNKIFKNNERKNTKVFVFAKSEGNAKILDSIDKGNLLAKLDESKFKDSDFVSDSELFKVRRIDETRMLALKTVEKADIFSKYTVDGDEKVISVLLMGIGEYGIELFKTLVWYGQMKGYRLEINVVDKRPLGESNAEKILAHHCPEIFATNNIKTTGDAFYSIEFFNDVDVLSGDWDEIMCYQGDDPEKQRRLQRLKRTTVAIVALGDDDKNIRAAVELRVLFDRANNVVAKADISADELPSIYSIVFSEQKTQSLRQGKASDDLSGFGNNDNCELRNYRSEPYHIHFIGSFSSQYNYDDIYPLNEEQEAFKKCHISWVYEDISKGKEVNIAEMRKNETKKYEDFEYYRLSSVSKAKHKILISEKEEFRKQFSCLKDNAYDCDCENCWERRRNEHNRWNAYVRSIGYVYGEKRADRAKVHHNLVPFDMLSYEDKLKD